MYTIEVNNEYRSDGFGYEDDVCPMNYYIVRDHDSVLIAETDWAYGFMTIEQACEVARRYTQDHFAVMIDGETHYF